MPQPELIQPQIQIIRKPVKHLRLTVYPRDGLVRVSVPLHLDDEYVRRFIASRQEWILQKLRQPLPPKPVPQAALKDGDTLHLAGKPHQFRIIADRANRVELREDGIIELRVDAALPLRNAQMILNEWLTYRLKNRAEPLLRQWMKHMDLSAKEWGIKAMKTRWGSCNYRVGRIWLSLELAKYPDESLELIIVHELCHLLEPSHNRHFKALMDQFLPDWRERRQRLRHFGL